MISGWAISSYPGQETMFASRASRTSSILGKDDTFLGRNMLWMEILHQLR